MSLKQAYNRRGFTLIELLAVMPIIGILIAMIIGIAALANRKSNDSRVRAEMQKISNSLEEYRVLYGSFPEKISDMTAAGSKLSPEYKNFPVKDPWGKEYYYTNSSRYAFSLRSLGSDKQIDTSDDIVSGTY